nr:zinc-binding of primase-helicase family domain protein [Yersinia pestis PY-32]
MWFALITKPRSRALTVIKTKAVFAATGRTGGVLFAVADRQRIQNKAPFSARLCRNLGNKLIHDFSFLRPVSGG